MASFEGELGPALVRILEAQSLDNENDRAVLLNAIALFSTRNPRQRETVREFHENTSHIMMELATATKEGWEAQMRKVREAGEMKDPPDVPYDEMRDFVMKKKYKLSFGAEYQIGLEMGSFETILPYMFKRKWIACVAPQETLMASLRPIIPLACFGLTRRCEESFMALVMGFRAQNYSFRSEIILRF